MRRLICLGVFLFLGYAACFPLPFKTVTGTDPVSICLANTVTVANSLVNNLDPNYAWTILVYANIPDVSGFNLSAFQGAEDNPTYGGSIFTALPLQSATANLLFAIGSPNPNGLAISVPNGIVFQRIIPPPPSEYPAHIEFPVSQSGTITSICTAYAVGILPQIGGQPAVQGLQIAPASDPSFLSLVSPLSSLSGGGAVPPIFIGASLPMLLDELQGSSGVVLPAHAELPDFQSFAGMSFPPPNNLAVQGIGGGGIHAVEIAIVPQFPTVDPVVLLFSGSFEPL